MMNKLNDAFLAAALFACLTSMPDMAVAQTSDLAVRQASGLDRVAGVSGDWQMTKFVWDGRRNDWSDAASGTDAGSVSFERMGHGKAFRVTLRSPQFLVDGFFTYDVWTDRYVLASIDDQIGQIDVQQGGFAEDQLILDNLKADTTYSVRSTPTHTRLELQFVGGQLSAIRIDSSQDQGKIWKPTSLFRVRRTAAAK